MHFDVGYGVLGRQVEDAKHLREKKVDSRVNGESIKPDSFSHIELRLLTFLPTFGIKVCDLQLIELEVCEEHFFVIKYVL